MVTKIAMQNAQEQGVIIKWVPAWGTHAVKQNKNLVSVGRGKQ